MKKYILFLIMFFMIGISNVRAYAREENILIQNNKNYSVRVTNLFNTSKVNIDFDTSNGCASYLGDPDDSLYKPPAYYLQFLFNLMKYIALVLLFVMTIVEFAKATVSENQDAIKKAMQNTVKRIILVIIVIMLPNLIKFILTVLGIYAAGTCGVS